MSRRRTNHMEDSVLAREVVVAAAAVTGADVDLALNGPNRWLPEFCVVRHAAAVALTKIGWSHERVGRHVHVDRKHLVEASVGKRLEVGAPKVLAAAVAAAERVIGKAAQELSVAAREAMRYEAALVGLSAKSAATSKSPMARDVRMRVAKRLYARNYGGTAIAKALGYAETTVYRWLGD